MFERGGPEECSRPGAGPHPIDRACSWAWPAACRPGSAAVAQNRGIQLRSVASTVEGRHDIRGILGADSDVRNGFTDIKVSFSIDADASQQEIEALVAQSQKRSAVFDALTNPTDVTVEVAERAEPSSTPTRWWSAPARGSGRQLLPAARSVDHLVLERGEVANSWRRERWDWLRLLTPNWLTRLPDHQSRAHLDGLMAAGEVAGFVAASPRPRGHQCDRIRTVASVRREGDGYRVRTESGEIQTRTVVVASGRAMVPIVPALRKRAGLHQATDTLRLHRAWRSARWRCAGGRRHRPPECNWRPNCGARDGRWCSRRGSTCGCPGCTAAGTSCGGCRPPESGTSATTRSTTSSGPARCPRRSSSGPRSVRPWTSIP